MKNMMIMAMLVVSFATFAQNNKPKLTEENGMVKATYFFDNGTIQQEGFFKNGKLEGKWISYNQNGTKKTIAEYSEGNKTGKWFFWNENSLSEVDYSDNAIASVKNWNNSSIASSN
jgi:antitoxin component YwqK of YwqJK toxin-antitoxin module